jgi:hypothetical protein
MKHSSLFGSRILVTGDLGFVGQHALEQWPNAVGLAQVCPEIDIREKNL